MNNEDNDDDLDDDMYDTIDQEEVEELLAEPKGLDHEPETNNDAIDNQGDENVNDNEEENIVSDVDDKTLEEIVDKIADDSTKTSEI